MAVIIRDIGTPRTVMAGVVTVLASMSGMGTPITAVIAAVALDTGTVVEAAGTAMVGVTGMAAAIGAAVTAVVDIGVVAAMVVEAAIGAE